MKKKNGCAHCENLGKKVYSVASVPGRIEEKEGRPLAGQAGKIHDKVLSFFCYKGRRLRREMVSITNAWPKPIYYAQDKRTEATLQEISQLWNLERLNKEISNACAVVICWGAKALYAVRLVKSRFNRSFAIVEAEHPSLSHLNRCYKSAADTAEKRTEDRVRQFAEKVKKNVKGLLS